MHARKLSGTESNMPSGTGGQKKCLKVQTPVAQKPFHNKFMGEPLKSMGLAHGDTDTVPILVGSY